MNYMDTEALVRAIGIGVATGLVAAGFISLRSGKKGKRSLLSIALVIALISTLILYFAWPSKVEVPALEGLSKKEAIEFLEKNKLVPQLDSQITIRTRPGVVIEGSQIPESGTKVPVKSTVAFTVSAFFENYIKFVSPAPNSKVPCEILPSNFGRVYVSATLKIAPEQIPLLWIKGVNPSTPVWYLQKYPFGLSRSPEKDFWVGYAQIGNPEYPPLDDHEFDFAISVIDERKAEQWLGEPGEFSVPNPLGNSVTMVNNVKMAPEKK